MPYQHFLYTVLQFFFDDCDNQVREGSRLSTPLVQYYGSVQNPFTLILRTMSVSSAESVGLGNFIGSDTISNSSRATESMSFANQWDFAFVIKNEGTSFM